MADRIKLLPEVVANQIAAGEVVNRPSSVIKEMMENSIDAGSSCIIVNFRDGGGDLIQIVDNGCGMSPNDARMAFDRHATSKISQADDIYRLSTFGFRGEALASIAAVSHVELRTRQVTDEIGTATMVDGGEFASQTPISCEVGSQFFVRNLFYNVPARRRFMDKVTTSSNQIKAEFKRIALCNPDIHFELYANDSPLYNLPPSSLAGRIVDVVGRSIKHNLLEIKAKTSIVKIRGYIGRPEAAKKTNNEQYLFVNGRYFKSPFFTKAILKGYEKLIAVTHTPSYFLYFDIDPERIDVNVHPQKTEVKFADNDDIWQIIVAAVRETLAKNGAMPMMDFDDQNIVDIPVHHANDHLVMPKSSSGAPYNPFNEGYIDPLAPDPNVDFTGFDVPYPSVGAAKPKRRVSELKEGAYRSMMEEFSTEESIMSQVSPSSGSILNNPRFDEYDNIASSFDLHLDDETTNIESGSLDINLATQDDTEIMSESIVSSFAPSDAINMVDVKAYESVQESTMIGIDIDSASLEDGYNSEFDSSSFEFIESASEQQPLKNESNTKVESDVRSVTPLGDGCSFMVVDGVPLILDLVRAKERILYDQYIATLDSGSSVSQQLLFSEHLILSLDEYTLLEENLVDFAIVGFDIELLGKGEINVKGIPPEVGSEGVDTLIFELLGALSTPQSIASLRRENLALVMARSGAVSARRSLSVDQITELAKQLFMSDNTSFSPSGKPLMWRITSKDIRDKLS